MPQHREQRTLPYSAQALFDLVADVERYPEFLPWCLECRITDQTGPHAFQADLTIGYKLFRETFTSAVNLTPARDIHVRYIDGPLRNLTNTWHFTDHGDSTCTIDFYIDFTFYNPILGRLMGVFFHEAFRRMVAAFEARATAVYGPPAPTRKRR
jgi:coenzyme Q-binding protein COQ10